MPNASKSFLGGLVPPCIAGLHGNCRPFGLSKPFRASWAAQFSSGASRSGPRIVLFPFSKRAYDTKGRLVYIHRQFSLLCAKLASNVKYSIESTCAQDAQGPFGQVFDSTSGTE